MPSQPIPSSQGAHLKLLSGRASAPIAEAASSECDAVLQMLGGSKAGLSDVEAARRLVEHGPNVVARDRSHPRLRLLFKALVNPLVLLLLVLAAFSFLTGDDRAGIVMLVMVAIGVVLRFVQESRADSAAAALRAMISVHATVLRDGRSREVPIRDLVPGDTIELAAGDMIPADVRWERYFRHCLVRTRRQEFAPNKHLRSIAGSTGF